VFVSVTVWGLDRPHALATMKNVIRLENKSLPRDVDQKIVEFVRQHNHRWFHESLDSLTPVDV
jgi:putative transposase